MHCPLQSLGNCTRREVVAEAITKTPVQAKEIKISLNCWNLVTFEPREKRLIRKTPD